MNTFSFYDPVTGIFNGRTFSGPAELLPVNGQAGFTAVAGEYDAMSQRYDVASGTVVSYQPPAPASTALVTWAWNATASRWLPSPTLASLKLDKWATIKVARAAAIDAPLVTPLGTFDADAASRANIIGAVLLAQTLTAQSQPVTISFTLADNTVAVLNSAQMTTVGLALGSKTQAAYTRWQTLRAQIDAATTDAALLAITW